MKSVADGIKAIREGAGRLGSARGWLGLELVLVAVLAVQAARIVMIFVTPASDAQTQPPATVAADAGIFARFDAFFRTGGQGSLAEATGADAGQMRLYGVRAGGPDGGSAIIGLPDGKQVSVAVGETVQPGLVLRAVAADHVVLARGGSLSRLIFTEAPAGVPAPPPPPPGDQVVTPVTTAEPAPPPVNVPPPVKSRPPLPGLEPAKVLAEAGLRPRLRGARIDGFTVGGRSDSPLLRSAGLQPGDVVLAVNNTPLNGLQALTDLRGKLSDADSAEIRFERNGQVQTTTIRALR